MIPFVYFLFAVYPSAFRGGQLRERGAEAARSRAMMRRTPGWHAAVLPLSTGSCLPSPRRAHVCPRRRTIPRSPARPTPLTTDLLLLRQNRYRYRYRYPPGSFPVPSPFAFPPPIHARLEEGQCATRGAEEGRGAVHPLTG